MGRVASMLARPVYGYAEIDRLLRLTPGTAKRWIDGYERTGRVYEPVVRQERTGSPWVTTRWPTHGRSSPRRVRSCWWRRRSQPAVWLHPLRRQGQPTVDSIRTETLAELVTAGEPMQFVADTYGLTLAEVEQAVTYQTPRRRAA
ncbi:MAG: hypothetical protein ACRDQU_06680 [Pseudonocardiaceae bacterium]